MDAEVLSWWQRDALLLLLLGWCNFLPILGRVVFQERLAYPVDLGAFWLDGRPAMGPHKTWRGLALSVAGTALAADLAPFGWAMGLRVGILSMTGDLATSFVKRRLGFEYGRQALALDQGLESLLPLVDIKGELGLTWTEVAGLVALFVALEILLSPVLYRLHIRRNPH